MYTATLQAQDTITIAGNNNPEQINFHLHQISIHQGDSIASYIIEDPGDSNERMFQLASIRYNGKYLIGGRGIKNDSIYALIYALNSNGSLDTLVSPIHTDLTATIWDMYIDSENLLNVFIT